MLGGGESMTVGRAISVVNGVLPAGRGRVDAAVGGGGEVAEVIMGFYIASSSSRRTSDSSAFSETGL